MKYEIVLIESKEQIKLCFDVFKDLRPHIEEDKFVDQVLRQQEESFQILAIKVGDKVVSAAGFRFGEYFAWGKIIYIDDLSTLPAHRGNSYAEILMDWLIDHAKTRQCKSVHLDPGLERHAAHKLYLKKNFDIGAHHLSLEF